MSHNLNYNSNTNQHSFFSVKEKAWHNLGQIIEHYPTSSEAIVYAGLDFEVEKRPLFTCDSENFAVFNDVERSFINVRIYVHSYFISWAFLEYRTMGG